MRKRNPITLAGIQAKIRSHCVETPGPLATPCLIWQRSCDGRGYGQIRFRGRQALTHRLVLSDPRGKFALHHCDTPRCNAVTHIYAGSSADNSRDMMERGRSRSPRGDQHGNAKLSSKDVREMRHRHSAGGVTQMELAREFGVSPANAHLVIQRKRWAHID